MPVTHSQGGEGEYLLASCATIRKESYRGAVVELVHAVNVIGPHLIIGFPIALGVLLGSDGASAVLKQDRATGDGVVWNPLGPCAGESVCASRLDSASCYTWDRLVIYVNCAV